MSSKFKYRERSAETVAARSKQSGGNFDSYLNSSLNFLKVKEGTNDLRILPPTWDVEGPFGDNWGIEVYVHRDIGPDKGTYLCLDKMREKYGKAVPSKLGECPLCAARHDVAEDDEAALKALKPGKQILCYVINRADEKAGPQVWRLGWQLERDIQIRSQDKKSGAVIPLDSPDHGYDVSFTREGAGLKTKYVGVDIARDESPLSEKPVRQQKWIDFVVDNPLSEQLVFYDADYLEQAYMGKKGAKGGSAEDEEEDDRPTRSKRAAKDEDEEDERPRRRAAKASDDDDDDDTRGRPRAGKPTGDDQDDDDDAEPAPKRRKPRDEEEEEEEQPRRRSSRAEPDEEEERPRRRAAKAEEDDDDDDRLPTDKEMKRNTERLKARPKDEDEEEDEPEPRRASTKKKPARDEEDEEEEDEPAPRRTSSKKPPKDEEEDEDEDEDEAPKGKASDKAKESLKRLSKGKR